MKFIGPYTLLLPGEGWNTCTDRYFTTFEIYFNLRTGIIDVLETKKDNKMNTKKTNQKKSEEYKQNLINALIDFAKLKEILVDKEIIEKELYAFVLDEGGKYIESQTLLHGVRGRTVRRGAFLRPLRTPGAPGGRHASGS